METLGPVLSGVLPNSIQDDVMNLADYWKSIRKDNPQNQTKKLECLYKVDQVAAKFESPIEPLLTIMREGISDVDPFVRYSAAKALGNTINRCLHTDFSPLLGDLISHMFTSQDDGYKGSILDLLWHQTSYPVNEGQWIACLTVMSHQWGRMCKSCLFDLLDVKHQISNHLIKQKSFSVVLWCQFIRLWKKIIKKCAMGRKEAIKEFLTPVLDLVQNLNLEDRMSFRSSLKLIHVVVKNMTNISDLGREHRIIVIQLVTKLLNCFCPKWFEEFPRGFIDGFGGELTVHAVKGEDMSVLRTMASICIKLVSVVLRLVMDHTDIMAVFALLTSLDTWMDKTTHYSGFSWIPTVYSEQDDAWIDVLMNLLEIYMEWKEGIGNDSSSCDPEIVLSMIQPHQQFLLFLDNTGFDETFLLDLLISPETCFLSYLTQYLKVVRSEWTEFVKTHAEYRCHAAFNDESEFEEYMFKERAVNKQGQKISLFQEGDPQNKMTEGLTLLQQYGDDDDDDNEDEDEDDDDDDSDDHKNDLDEEERGCVDNITKYSSKDLGDQIDSQECDLPITNINKWLDKTMTALIRLRLRMERFTGSDVIQYNPKVLIHMIEEVEELYEQ